MAIYEQELELFVVANQREMSVGIKRLAAQHGKSSYCVTRDFFTVLNRLEDDPIAAMLMADDMMGAIE